MFTKEENPSFRGVALVLILIGAGLVSFGGVAWLSNMLADTSFVYPSVKIMGGLVILALGYIQLNLEFLRRK